MTIGNRGGIPYVTATQTSAGSTSTNAVYSLPDHTFRFLGPAGLVVLTVNTASDTTVTGVTMTVNGQSLAMTNNLNEAITTLAVGDYLVSFNKNKNTIKLFS